MILKTAAPVISSARPSTACPRCGWPDLVQDTRTLKVAQEEAKALLAVDPNLAMPQHRALSDEVDHLFATAGAMN